MSLPASLKTKTSLDRSLSALTLDAFLPVAPKCYGYFLTAQMQAQLRQWYSDMGKTIGVAATDPTDETLAKFSAYVSPETKALVPAFENWLIRSARHDVDYSMQLWIEGLVRLKRAASLNAIGLSEDGTASLAELLETHYTTPAKCGFDVAAQFQKEWSPYARDDQLEYNLRVKSDWDKALYQKTLDDQTDFELGAFLQGVIERHAARNFMDIANDAMTPEDVTKLDGSFVLCLKYSDAYTRRPRRLAHFETSLKPFAAHHLTNTHPIEFT